MFDRSMLIPCASLCAFVCMTAPSLRAGDDPKEILRRALRVNARNHELVLAYTYVERDEQRTLDKAGAVAQRKSTTWDVIPLREESHYRRLIQRDDKPLSSKEEFRLQRLPKVLRRFSPRQQPVAVKSRRSAHSCPPLAAFLESGATLGEEDDRYRNRR